MQNLLKIPTSLITSAFCFVPLTLSKKKTKKIYGNYQTLFLFSWIKICSIFYQILLRFLKIDFFAIVCVLWNFHLPCCSFFSFCCLVVNPISLIALKICQRYTREEKFFSKLRAEPRCSKLFLLCYNQNLSWINDI